MDSEKDRCGTCHAGPISYIIISFSQFLHINSVRMFLLLLSADTIMVDPKSICAICTTAPWEPQEWIKYWVSSPHTRGCITLTASIGANLRVFPSHEGVYHRYCMLLAEEQGFSSHTRGCIMATVVRQEEFSGLPLTRGGCIVQYCFSQMFIVFPSREGV